MPPHTHLRRSEVYLYFDLPPKGYVQHFVGQPGGIRHLRAGNEQAVLSPPWSVHCGAGSIHYSFIWGMGGENQEFADMDPVDAAVILKAQRRAS
jgi:4-deoxy-L-threo-5-hexosulose-uronate ketol-isomerase